jgi:DNA-binding PadR family transcriptional regulator
MYYELIILGTLIVGPAHGYLIAKIIQLITGPYGKVSAGRLYPLLSKLEEQGLVVEEPQRGQPGNEHTHRHQIPSRRYHITEAGRDRLHQLMMDTTSYLGDYQKVFVQKVARFSFLQPVERLHLIEHYLGYCQKLVAYGTAQAEAVAITGGNQPASGNMTMTSAQIADVLVAMQHTIERWQRELAWAERLREQVKATIQTPASPSSGTGS